MTRNDFKIWVLKQFSRLIHWVVNSAETDLDTHVCTSASISFIDDLVRQINKLLVDTQKAMAKWALAS